MDIKELITLNRLPLGLKDGITALCLVSFSFALAQNDSCHLLRLKQTFNSVDELLAGETVLDSHPWEVKFSTSLLSPESKQLRDIPDHLSFLGQKDPTNPASSVFGQRKLEATSIPHILFGHVAIQNDRGEFYPKAQGFDGRIESIYPHAIPHPGVMKHYQKKTLYDLFSSYAQQKLPPQAWHSMLLDEFSLADYRSINMAISHKLDLRAFARFYIGDRKIADELRYIESDAPSSQVFTLGIKAGEFPAYTTPAERLLQKFGIKENPIEDLRRQFPNHRIVEIGRLLISDNMTAEQNESTKKLLSSTVLSTLRELAPERDLSKIIIVASSGPFGARQYPKLFGMNQIFKTELDWSTLAQTLPEGAEVQDGLNIQFNWVPKLDVINAQKQERLRDITIFGTTGDVFEKHLKESYGFLSNIPTWDEIPFMAYDLKPKLR